MHGKLGAGDSIARLQAPMALPTRESIFSQLAVERDTPAASRKIVHLTAV